VNSDYERNLEAQIDRELRALPDLRAPAALHSRVMAAIERKASKKQTAWSAWPAGTRFAVLLVLTAGFTGLCLAGWELRETAFWGSTASTLRGFWSFLGIFAHLSELITSSLVLIVKNLNGVILAGLVVALALAYFTWAALGALWFRIAFASRQPTDT